MMETQTNTNIRITFGIHLQRKQIRLSRIDDIKPIDSLPIYNYSNKDYYYFLVKAPILPILHTGCPISMYYFFDYVSDSVKDTGKI